MLHTVSICIAGCLQQVYAHVIVTMSHHFNFLKHVVAVVAVVAEVVAVALVAVAMVPTVMLLVVAFLCSFSRKKVVN